MRIGIDARYAIHRSGFGNYAVGLLGGLANVDLINNYFVYLDTRSLKNQDLRVRLPQHGSNFHIRYLPNTNPVVYQHLILAHSAYEDQVDVLHCLFNVAPLWLPARMKLVLTLHDAIFALGNSYIPSEVGIRSKMLRLYYGWLAPYSARRASIIFTDSLHSKRDLVSEFKLSPDKIKVVYLAPNPEFYQPLSTDFKEVLGRCGIRPPFILGYGSTEPRKNTRALLQAFSMLREVAGFQHKLVLVGARTVGWARTDLARFSREVGIEKDVFPLGMISTSDLRVLYSMADVFVNATLYEGFGLPILEAMACGVPVVCSNAASVPEIAGEAAIIIDPRDPAKIAEAIASLLSEPQLAQELRQKGKQRARMFSWDRSAATIVSCYQTVGGN